MKFSHLHDRYNNIIEDIKENSIMTKYMKMGKLLDKEDLEELFEKKKPLQR